MTPAKLVEQLSNIVSMAWDLKDLYISEDLGLIDYVAIFPQTFDDQTVLKELLLSLQAVTVYSDPGGGVYHFSTPLLYTEQPISLVKICTYDPQKRKLGYVDFRTDRYPELKKKYLGASNFVTIEGDGWELIGVEDPESVVAFYIPNIPLSKDLGLH